MTRLVALATLLVACSGAPESEPPATSDPLEAGGGAGGGGGVGGAEAGGAEAGGGGQGGCVNPPEDVCNRTCSGLTFVGCACAFECPESDNPCASRFCDVQQGICGFTFPAGC